MTRVVVVGAGIGGCLAALAAAETDPDASVHLVSTASDRFRYEPGTIDVLGYTPGADGPIERPLVAMQSLPDDHPYHLVGTDGVRRALDYADELLGDDEELPYRSGGTRNALVPTVTGNVRPTSRYPEGIAAGLASSQRPMHLVGFEQETHFDADLVADRLDGVLPYEVTGTTIEFPLDPSESPPFEEFARALDENRETADGTPLREAFVEAVRPELDVEPRVGLPVTLGIDEHEAVRRELESLLRVELFEIPVGEPSLPGIRLGNRLAELAADAGVERTEGTVTGFGEADGEVRSVHLEGGDSDGETAVEGDAFVLATGDLAAGGLVGTGDDVVEPVFDCPVTHPERRVGWSSPDPLGDHPFARFGVDVTPALQPATSTGEPLYENLYAAGTVLGGHNFTRERSRGGVGVVTGYEAGRLAVQGD